MGLLFKTVEKFNFLTVLFLPYAAHQIAIKLFRDCLPSQKTNLIPKSC